MLAKSSLEGGSYLVDFIDISPPMGFWFYLPIYPIHHESGLSLESSIWLYLSLLPILPIYLLIKESKKANELVVMLSLVGSIIVATMHNFAYAMNKDVIATLFMLPWLYCFVVKSRPGKMSFLLGAIGVIAKPHFIVIPLIIAFVNLLTYRSGRSFLYPLLPFLITGIVYIAAVYFVHPEFYSSIPNLLEYYSGRMSLEFNLLQFVKVNIIYLGILVIPFYNSNISSVSKRLLLVAGVFCVVALLQFKGIIYHYFGCSVFLCSLVLVLLFQEDNRRFLKSIAMFFLAYCSITLAISNNYHSVFVYEALKDKVKEIDIKGKVILLSCPNSYELNLPLFSDLQYDLMAHSSWFICKGMGDVSVASIEAYSDLVIRQIETEGIDYLYRIIRADGNDQGALDMAFNIVSNSVSFSEYKKFQYRNKDIVIYKIEKSE